MNKNQTIFVTFEGVEGCGKTTQFHLLSSWLQACNVPVQITREPGGTEIGEQIRAILMRTSNCSMSPAAEALLLAASRAQLVAEVIKPALNTEGVLLSDRYADASIAYQAYGRGLPLETVVRLIEFATGGIKPHLTVLIDIDPGQSLKRARQRDLSRNLSGLEDRFEREEITFHRRVRQGYLTLAEAEPERVRIVQGAQSVECVQRDIRSLFVAQFPHLKLSVE